MSEDLKARFGVGGICVVADRGLVSADNLQALGAQGFSHVLATCLHRDPACAAALEASTGKDAVWVAVPDARSAACDVVVDDTRYVVVASFERHRRDTKRTAELAERTADKLRGLERRVRDGALVDPAKIGRAAQRILGASGVGRLFDVEMAKGHFLWHYDEKATAYEELLAGRYVLTTSLSTAEASPAAVVRAYRQLLEVEDRFRVLNESPSHCALISSGLIEQSNRTGFHLDMQPAAPAVPHMDRRQLAALDLVQHRLGDHAEGPAPRVAHRRGAGLARAGRRRPAGDLRRPDDDVAGAQTAPARRAR